MAIVSGNQMNFLHISDKEKKRKYLETKPPEQVFLSNIIKFVEKPPTQNPILPFTVAYKI